MASRACTERFYRLHVFPIYSFDIEGHVTTFGNPTWAKTHGPATGTAPAIAALTAAGGADALLPSCRSLILLNAHATRDGVATMAEVAVALWCSAATGVGKTVMCELAFNLTGENVHYGTPKARSDRAVASNV